MRACVLYNDRTTPEKKIKNFDFTLDAVAGLITFNLVTNDL